MLFTDERGILLSYISDVRETLEAIATAAISTIPNHSFTISFNIFTHSRSETQIRLLSEPRLGVWVRNVQSAINMDGLAYLQSPSAQRYLDSFAAFAFASAFIERRAFRVEVSGIKRLVMPTTGYFIELPSERVSAIELTISGELFVNGARTTPRASTFTGNFELSTGELLLEPPHGELKWLPDLDESERCAWLSVMTSACDLVEMHEPSAALTKLFGPIIVPVAHEVPDTHCSVSFGNIPRVLYMSYSNRADVIAEAMVHESDHQLFYCFVEFDEVWSNPQDQQDALYRSPWREDPRPLDGLLRGASAFARVSQFWCAVVTNSCNPEFLDLRGQRSVLCAMQAIEAISIIETRGCMTRQGLDVLANLKAVSIATIEILTNMDRYDEWANHAKAIQNAHNDAWNARNPSLVSFN